MEGAFYLFDRRYTFDTGLHDGYQSALHAQEKKDRLSHEEVIANAFP